MQYVYIYTITLGEACRRNTRSVFLAIPLRGRGKIRNERHCDRRGDGGESVRASVRAFVRACVRSCERGSIARANCEADTVVLADAPATGVTPRGTH